MHPTLEVKTSLSSWEKPKFEFMGFLLFSLCFHAVQVPNCMTTSTISHACEKTPSLDHGGDFAIWESDFEPSSSHFGKKLTSSIQMMWRFNNLLRVPSWKMTSGQQYYGCLLDL
jgi:hypothetical protein